MRDLKWLLMTSMMMIILLARELAATTVGPTCSNPDLCHVDTDKTASTTTTTTSTVDNSETNNNKPLEDVLEERNLENPVEGGNEKGSENEDGDDETGDDDKDEDEDEDEESDEYISQLDACRRHPTWEGDGVDFETCQEVTEYYPRDTWWRVDTEFATETTGEGAMETLRQCLNQALLAENAPQQLETEPMHVSGSYHHVQNGDIVIVQNVLTDQEAYALTALKECVNASLGDNRAFYRERAFETGPYDSEMGLYDYGGNYCTYVQGLVQFFLPGVAASIYTAISSAYEYSEWEDEGFRGLPYPPPESLGVRTMEYLEYKRSGRLGNHRDDGSIFTMSINLSEPTDFEGGYFYVKTEDVLVKVSRLAGIVFFAESAHGVTEIRGGNRNVFVTELWKGDDAAIGFPRPTDDAMMEHIEARGPIIEQQQKAATE